MQNLVISLESAAAEGNGRARERHLPPKKPVHHNDHNDHRAADGRH